MNTDLREDASRALTLAAAPAAVFWRDLAGRARRWLAGQRVAARDAVVLLPYAAWLPPARQAFAEQDGWPPRIETVRTLVQGLPPPAAGEGQGPSGEAAIDRLRAASLLRVAGWLPAALRRDRRAFDHLVGQVVEAAAFWAAAAAATPPAARAAFFERAGEALPAAAGPGALEAGLARLALAWAASADDPLTDAAFGHPAAAWIWLEAAGRDALTEAVVDDAAARGVPVLRLCADGAAGAAPDLCGTAEPPCLYRAPDAESEAWAAATEVLQQLAAGHAPVALVAEDREAVRRIRALLERRQVRVADETGWTLATTRAAARAMACLRAARAGAGADERLDALKSEFADGDEAARAFLQRLEARWRRPAPGAATDDDELERWWAQQRQRLEAWAAGGRRPLADWLAALARRLDEAADAPRWQADAAAQSLRLALRLPDAEAGPAPPAPGWAEVAARPLSLDEFIDWVGAVLEAATFLPPPAGDAAEVVITPLARALFRPFGAIVLPGADERHLGVAPAAPALVGEAVVERLGLEGRAGRRRRTTLAFGHLLRQGRVVLLRREADGDELLGPSPLVDLAEIARRAAGWPPIVETAAPRVLQRRPPEPVLPPSPVAGPRLPERVSASEVEALRDCPYRFFSRAVLGLKTDEELDGEADARDHGNWLHAVLQAFHEQRLEPAAADVEITRLVALADARAEASGRDAAAMWPFRAGLEAFARRYVAWLHQRDREGWRTVAVERPGEVDAGEGRGPRLVGRIDRVDRQGSGPAAPVQLIDYKTGRAERLKRRVAEPAEDTQLAAYAAIHDAAPAGDAAPLSAIYLALDDREGIATFEHPGVRESGRELRARLAADWQRLRAGAPLPALGDGELCEHCEARGLCRRDDRAPGAPAQ